MRVNADALIARAHSMGCVVEFLVVADATHRDAAVALVQRVARDGGATVEADRAESRAIDREAFFGPNYVSGRLRIPSSGPVGPDLGYAYAFGDPPYRMQGTEDEIADLFEQINHELFGECELDIQQWSTDWSSCFRLGDEWWGSFLWTVRPIGRDYVVAIAASTTD